MQTRDHIVRGTPFDYPPKMETSNEHEITNNPHETTCYTDADTVWDSNFPRGLEVISHGEWKYGPRGDFDL